MSEVRKLYALCAVQQPGQWVVIDSWQLHCSCPCSSKATTCTCKHATRNMKQCLVCCNFCRQSWSLDTKLLRYSTQSGVLLLTLTLDTGRSALPGSHCPESDRFCTTDCSRCSTSKKSVSSLDVKGMLQQGPLTTAGYVLSSVSAGMPMLQLLPWRRVLSGLGELPIHAARRA